MSAAVAVSDAEHSSEKGTEGPRELAIEGGASVIDTPDLEKDDSTDGDDALKLAGAHAHHFDEKYFSTLRLKIVSKPTENEYHD